MDYINNNNVDNCTESLSAQCYKLAYNILSNTEMANICVESAISSIQTSRVNNPTLHTMRVTRQLAFLHYTSSATKDSLSNDNSNELHLILSELDECRNPKSKKEENVIPLQLSSVVDELARELPLLERAVFTRRYFFAESITDLTSKYAISEKKINKILKRCRKSLRTLLDKKGYIIKKETLFDGFNNIGDELLRDIDNVNNVRMRKYIIQTAVAASALVLLAIGITIALILSDSSNATGNSGISDRTEDIYIDTSELFAKATLIEESTVSIQYTNNYKIVYTLAINADIDDFSEYIGEMIALPFLNSADVGYDCWFKIKGHKDMQYLLKKNDENSYSLWKFLYMFDINGNEFPYSDTLQMIYGIDSPDDIVGLTLTDSMIDSENNADTAPTQNEITDTATLTYLYYTLSDLTCYGPNNADMITSSYVETGISPVAYNLSITTAAGTTFTDMHFNSIFGCLFGDKYVAYNKLGHLTINALGALLYTDYVDATKTEDWMLHITPQNVTPTSITLEFTQYGGSLGTSLELINKYEIQKVDDSGNSNIQKIGSTDSSHTFPIPPDATISYEITWDDIYGELSAGQYNLWLEINGPNGINTTTEKRVFIVDFKIP